MRGIRLAAAALTLTLLCACGKQVKNYRIYDDLVISFTEALGDRTLTEEKLTKSEDGRKIIEASYTYKSKNAEEDRENYLYYLLNNNDAAFLSDDVVTFDSRDMGYVIIIRATAHDGKFTINLSREER